MAERVRVYTEGSTQYVGINEMIATILQSHLVVALNDLSGSCSVITSGLLCQETGRQGKTSSS